MPWMNHQRHGHQQQPETEGSLPGGGAGHRQGGTTSCVSQDALSLGGCSTSTSSTSSTSSTIGKSASIGTATTSPSLAGCSPLLAPPMLAIAFEAPGQHIDGIDTRWQGSVSWSEAVGNGDLGTAGGGGRGGDGGGFPSLDQKQQQPQQQQQQLQQLQLQESRAGNDASPENCHQLDNIAVLSNDAGGGEKSAFGGLSTTSDGTSDIGGPQLPLAQLVQQQQQQLQVFRIRLQQQEQRQRQAQQQHVKDRNQLAAQGGCSSPDLGGSTNDLRLLLEDDDEGADYLDTSFSSSAAPSGNTFTWDVEHSGASSGGSCESFDDSQLLSVAGANQQQQQQQHHQQQQQLHDGGGSGVTSSPSSDTYGVFSPPRLQLQPHAVHAQQHSPPHPQACHYHRHQQQQRQQPLQGMLSLPQSPRVSMLGLLTPGGALSPASACSSSPTVSFDDAVLFPPLCDLGSTASPASASNGSFMGSEEGDVHTPTSLRLPNLPFQGRGGFERFGGGDACCGTADGGDCPLDDVLRHIEKAVSVGGGGEAGGSAQPKSFGLVAASTTSTALEATASAWTTDTTLASHVTAYNTPAGAPVCAAPHPGVLERQERRTPAAEAMKTANTRVAAGSKKRQQTQVSQKSKAKAQQQQQQQLGHVRTPSSAVKAGETLAEGSRPRKVSRACSVAEAEERATTKHKKDHGSLSTGGGDDGNGTSGAGGGDKTCAKRLKNREHSRRSRERKKARMESLSDMADVLGPLRVLVEQAWDMFSLHSPNVNAIFMLASTGFDRLLGIDPRCLAGKSLLDLVHPKDAPAVASAIVEILDHRGRIKQVRYQMRPLPGTGVLTAEVETSFRIAKQRLVACTRVRSRGPSSLLESRSKASPLCLAAGLGKNGGGGGGGRQMALMASVTAVPQVNTPSALPLVVRPLTDGIGGPPLGIPSGEGVTDEPNSTWFEATYRGF